MDADCWKWVLVSDPEEDEVEFGYAPWVNGLWYNPPEWFEEPFESYW